MTKKPFGNFITALTDQDRNMWFKKNLGGSDIGHMGLVYVVSKEFKWNEVCRKVRFSGVARQPRAGNCTILADVIAAGSFIPTAITSARIVQFACARLTHDPGESYFSTHFIHLNSSEQHTRVRRVLSNDPPRVFLELPYFYLSQLML
jgi:hypothetical protein